MTDHYATLGVPRDASAADIKAAYRRLSSKHHPDREGGDAETMQAVNRAYECLSDPERRETYDRLGVDGPVTLDVMAEDLLRQLFTQALDQDVVPDLVAFARNGISAALGQKRVQLDAQVRGRDRMARKRAAVRLRKGASSARDVFSVLVQTQLARFEDVIREHEMAIKIMERTIELLADYESAEATRPRTDTDFFRAQFFGGRR